MDDIEIRTVVARLSRPHKSGGVVIERAAILAAGGDYRAIIDWILDHDGVGEVAASRPTSGGLHGGRVGYTTMTQAGTDPQRYVMPKV